MQDLWAGYDGNAALESISLELGPGLLVGVAGPNGSGKSTLLKTILGLVRPWRGRIELFGKDVNGSRNRVGYAPQSEVVDWDFPVTVRDVVMMGRYGRLGLLRRPGGADRDAVASALAEVRLVELAGRQISELSGGQQRRMLIARALAQEADLLLLDEPMVGLDATNQHELLDLFERLRSGGKTLLVATHDLSCVAACFDLTLLLNKKLVAFGPPGEIFTPELLNEAYAEHMLMLPTEGGVFVGHHGHG
ncbi:MAG: metal ABC transporter ATP-binding protein [Chloroflexi bacterium]|nr:metal ABC transporter ATP-binding protein [Chloroflexota bacterium]